MQLTSQILLDTRPEQDDALKRTLSLTNTCCDFMSKLAFEHKVFSRFKLQKIAYREVRDSFPVLAAQIVIRAFAKVSDAYALDRKIQRTFRPLGAISYDIRILSFKHEDKTVSIWTVDGRLKIPFKCGPRQFELLQGKRGEADLCLINGKFFLLVACEIETPEPLDIDGFLGVDLGIVNVASDSDGEDFSGQAVDSSRRTFAHRRRNLQRNGSKATRRKLKKLSGRQARFQKDTNHKISKRIVQKAQDTKRGIALEDLGGIRDRVTVRRKQRARLANWSFFQLRAFIHYKAMKAGIPVVLVDPRNTSRGCSVCGYVDKANRKSQALFLCVSCGHSAPADTNAAVNISARAAVMRPMVGRPLPYLQATPL